MNFSTLMRSPVAGNIYPCCQLLVGPWHIDVEFSKRHIYTYIATGYARKTLNMQPPNTAIDSSSCCGGWALSITLPSCIS